MGVKIAEQFNLSGTLCVKMFETADDIIINELAPHPRNSGYYLIETCHFLQLDMYIFGILGALLADIYLLSCSMFSGNRSKLLKKL